MWWRGKSEKFKIFERLSTTRQEETLFLCVVSPAKSKVVIEIAAKCRRLAIEIKMSLRRTQQHKKRLSHSFAIFWVAHNHHARLLFTLPLINLTMKKADESNLIFLCEKYLIWQEIKSLDRRRKIVWSNFLIRRSKKKFFTTSRVLCLVTRKNLSFQHGLEWEKVFVCTTQFMLQMKNYFSVWNGNNVARKVTRYPIGKMKMTKESVNSINIITTLVKSF